MNDTGVLKREVGVFGATMMGLGSMVGTGVFVSIGVAAVSSGRLDLVPQIVHPLNVGRLFPPDH